MADSKKEVLKSVRQRKYLNKSFDAMRADLLTYARTYYADKIQDFSEVGLGGLFLDFAAFVGDSNSFYLDHQFSELDPETAVEPANIERMLRSAGVKIVGASPATATVTFFIEVPSEFVNGSYRPREDCLPIILEDTILTSENGTQFFLIEKVDFTKKKGNKLADAQIVVGTLSASGIATSYIISKTGICISGTRAQENVTVGNQFVPFRRITLSNPNVTEILTVSDTLGNVYYEVDNLTQDVVYRGITNTNIDNEIVKENLEIVPAPYRFTPQTDISTRSTTITFGGGSADSLNDDIIPDASEFAIPLYGKKTFPRLVVNPNSLLNTRTLGVAATNTTLSIEYRYGGGLSHNVPATSIKDVTTLRMFFPGSPPNALASTIRAKVEVTNDKVARGGEDAPSIDDLKLQIPAVRNAQSRIVTKEDLLARVYTLPSNFGRVFRAGVRSNPNNPLATQLFIISRDENSRLTTSSDSLKKNLASYLNQYRMISDAIDILDAGIINLSLTFEIIADPQVNKNILVQNVITKLKKYFVISNFQIDQPIILGDIHNIIFNTAGVIAINNGPDGINFESITGQVLNRTYPGEVFDVKSSTTKGMIIPSPGRIFEIRFPDTDIEGVAI